MKKENRFEFYDPCEVKCKEDANISSPVDVDIEELLKNKENVSGEEREVIFVVEDD